VRACVRVCVCMKTNTSFTSTANAAVLYKRSICSLFASVTIPDENKSRQLDCEN
jgi:hypothetical protein